MSVMDNLKAEQLGALFVEPVTRASLALSLTTVVRTNAESYRIPKVISDPTSAWVAEREEIPESTTTTGEITVYPKKVAAFDTISHELAVDSNPAAAGVIASRMVNSTAASVDSAFFGPYITDDEDPDYQAERPAGLESLPLANITRVDANPTANLDAWADLYFELETMQAPVTAWVTTKAIALALSKIKVGTGSNAPMLFDFVDGRRIIYGAPLYVSPHVTTGSVWAISKPSITTVLREDVALDVDSSVKFQSDVVALRSRMRLAFGFPGTKHVGLIRD
jgi:HK97 family phage major capsid protein